MRLSNEKSGLRELYGMVFNMEFLHREIPLWHRHQSPDFIIKLIIRSYFRTLTALAMVRHICRNAGG